MGKSVQTVLTLDFTCILETFQTKLLFRQITCIQIGTFEHFFMFLKSFQELKF